MSGLPSRLKRLRVTLAVAETGPRANGKAPRWVRGALGVVVSAGPGVVGERGKADVEAGGDRADGAHQPVDLLGGLRHGGDDDRGVFLGAVGARLQTSDAGLKVG